MKFILFASALVAFALATPLPKKHARRYFPEEDDPFRIKYLVAEDEQGILHAEDLLAPVPEVKISNSDVTFYLYTRNNMVNPDVIHSVHDLLKSPNFDPSRKNKFMIHGWVGEHETSLNTGVKAVLLAEYDVNVFAVDWSKSAKTFYTTAKNAVPGVGKIVGNFIGDMIDTFGYTPLDFSIVGFSLGAHVAGAAGATVAKSHAPIDFIVGLDPASPMYTVQNTEERLDTSDALHVHVIHTNGGFLGFKSALGHADFYPNGGSTQPGCGLDLVGGCAHERAVFYFVESIRTSGFVSHVCDSMEDYSSGRCHDNDRTFMGEYHVDKLADGDYFLKTSSKSPYALG